MEKKQIGNHKNSYGSIFEENLLANQVALVTGGGSGIGLEISTAFVLHGCSVAICGRNEEKLKDACNHLKLLSRSNQNCVYVVADVRHEKEVRICVDYVIKMLGKVNILVNNAAGNFLCSADKMSINGFKAVLKIDLFGTFTFSKVVFETCFAESEDGESSRNQVIINITAPIHKRGMPLQCHAGSAKAAIEALTKHLAVEWGHKHVRVNCVSPGPIASTEGLSRLKGSQSFEELAAKIPLRRLGEKSDIANAVLFLSSSLAANYITGTTLTVDGGSWMTMDNYWVPQQTTSGAKL